MTADAKEQRLGEATTVLKPVGEGRPYGEQSAEWRAGYDEADAVQHARQRELRSALRLAEQNFADAKVIRARLEADKVERFRMHEIALEQAHRAYKTASDERDAWKARDDRWAAVQRSEVVQSLRCAECGTVTVPIPTCPECGDEYVSERSEAAWAARQRRESARNDAPERRQSEASVPLATPSASIACVHGAWNADGSCCTCGARGTAPWYRHAVYPKPGALSKEAQAAPPLPPDVLVSALQDRVHREVGAARPAKAVRVHEHDVDNRTEAALGREMPNAGPAVAMPPGWRGHNEADDHGAEDLPPVKTFAPLTPREALDAMFHGAVERYGGTRACELVNVVRKALDAPRHVGPLGNDVTCEWIDRHVARLETSVKEATDESERLREDWADAIGGAKYSRDEHVAALEALEFSTRMATIEECVKVAAATQGGADSYHDMRDRIVRALRALREVKP